MRETTSAKKEERKTPFTEFPPNSTPKPVKSDSQPASIDKNAIWNLYQSILRNIQQKPKPKS